MTRMWTSNGEDDPMNPARGAVLGMLAGAVVYGIIALVLWVVL